MRKSTDVYLSCRLLVHIVDEICYGECERRTDISNLFVFYTNLAAHFSFSKYLYCLPRGGRTNTNTSVKIGGNVAKISATVSDTSVVMSITICDRSKFPLLLDRVSRDQCFFYLSFLIFELIEHTLSSAVCS